MTGYAVSVTGAPALPGTFPARYDDVRHNPGTFLHLEPGHSATVAYGIAKDTVPVTAQVWPNLAWRQACRLCGLTAAQRAQVDITLTKSAAGATKLKLERTGSGAIHGIASQTVLATGDGARFDIPQALLAYIFAHSTGYPTVGSAYVFSLWPRVTRSASLLTGTVAPFFAIFEADGSPSFTFVGPVNLQPRTGVVPAGEGDVGNADVNALGAHLLITSPDMWNPAMPASGAPGALLGQVGWGSFGPYASNAAGGKSESWALESLTGHYVPASGMTVAQIIAAEQAEWTKQHAVGGRYYADTTPTDPATIP